MADEKHKLRSKVGQILWVARQSRPNVLFDACDIASRQKNGQVKDILAANKTIKRIKLDRMTLRFQPLGDKNLSLLIYSDASLGNLVDGGTQGGYVILLVGEDGKFSPISWSSKKIRRVVRSTLAGETLACADAVDEGMFLSSLYAELTTGTADPKLLPLVCVTDCKSLADAVKSTKSVTEKRLRLDISAIKELIESQQVKELRWSDTGQQLADCLTKRGASPSLLMRILDNGQLP